MLLASFFGRLARLVDRIARDDDDDFGIGIVDHSLASEPRGRGEARRPVEQVFLLIARFAELVEALLYDHMTGRARAVAAACVFEMDAVPQHQIEDRAGF